MALGNLIPLIILLVVVGVGAFVGYHMWLWSNELAERAGKKMEKSNMSFTKEGGLRVGVKDVRNDMVADKTQNVLVNVWNHASLPNYKSRLGWNSTQAMDPRKLSATQPQQSSSSHRSSPSPSPSRPSASRSSSNVSRSAGAASGLSPPMTTQRRSASPVPGGW